MTVKLPAFMWDILAVWTVYLFERINKNERTTCSIAHRFVNVDC